MALSLQQACTELAAIDSSFRGSLQHASERMTRVGHHQLLRLERGITDPQDIKVRTMNELLRLFRRCKSITRDDFKARSPRPATRAAAS